MICRPMPARSLVLLILTLGLLLPPARTAEAGPDRKNAATWYQKAIDGLDRLDDDEMNALIEYVDSPNGAVPDGVRDTLTKSKSILANAHQGSRRSRFDMNLDFSAGFELLLPHLSPLRTLARLMSARGFVALHDGDAGAASREVAAMYRMAEHLGRDGLFISSLVAQSIWVFGDALAAAGFDNGRFTPDHGRTMLRGMNATTANDPFHMIDAVVGEQELVVDWLVDRFGEADDRQHMFEELGWLPNDDGQAETFLALTDDEFMDEVGEYDIMMDDVVSVFLEEDEEVAKAGIIELEERFEAGEFGLVASLLTPSFSRLHSALLRSRAQTAERRAMLESIAGGERTVQDEMNAALFYGQAMARMRSAETATVDQVCNAAVAEADLDEDARALRDEVLALIQEATEKSRCTLSLLRTERSSSVCPADLGGMRDLVRAVIAQWDRAANDEHLVRLLRMVAHLESDELLLTSLVAHETFDAVDERITNWLKTGPDDEDCERVLRAAEQVGRTDPFGYVAAVRDVQGLCHFRVQIYGVYEKQGSDGFAAAIASASRWNADQLLYLQVVFDTDQRLIRAAEEPDSAAVEPLDSIGDLVDRVAVRAARDEASAVIARLKAGEWKLFDDHVFLPVASVQNRRATARRDLRSLVAALRRAGERESDAGASGT